MIIDYQHCSGRELKIIGGTSHPILAGAIANALGVQLAQVTSYRTPSREVAVLMGESVREADVYIIQTNYSPLSSLNDNLFELLQLISVCRAGSAAKITAVIPCFPYARQDKRDQSRSPITAKLVANLLEISGANHIITMDLHAAQLQGFFSVPVDNLQAESLLIAAIKREILDTSNLILVTPDAGGAKRCASMAEKLNLPLALIHKERKEANSISKMFLVGDVRGKDVVIVDDMADTCGTIIEASKILKENGAKRIIASIVHPVFSGDSLQRLQNSFIDTIIYTNTLPVYYSSQNRLKLVQVDISSVFAEVIRRIHAGDSISSLFG